MNPGDWVDDVLRSIPDSDARYVAVRHFAAEIMKLGVWAEEEKRRWIMSVDPVSSKRDYFPFIRGV